jgi:hypothetical protein
VLIMQIVQMVLHGPGKARLAVTKQAFGGGRTLMLLARYVS